MSVETWLGTLSSGLKREKEPPVLYVVEGHDYGQHDVLGVYDTNEAAEAEVARLSAAETREAYYVVTVHRLNVPTPQE